MKLGTRATRPFDASDEADIFFKAEVQPHSAQTFTFTAPSVVRNEQLICGSPGPCGSRDGGEVDRPLIQSATSSCRPARRPSNR